MGRLGWGAIGMSGSDRSIAPSGTVGYRHVSARAVFDFDCDSAARALAALASAAIHRFVPADPSLALGRLAAADLGTLQRFMFSSMANATDDDRQALAGHFGIRGMMAENLPSAGVGAVAVRLAMIGIGVVPKVPGRWLPAEIWEGPARMAVLDFEQGLAWRRAVAAHVRRTFITDGQLAFNTPASARCLWLLIALEAGRPTSAYAQAWGASANAAILALVSSLASSVPSTMGTGLSFDDQFMLLEWRRAFAVGTATAAIDANLCELPLTAAPRYAAGHGSPATTLAAPDMTIPRWLAPYLSQARSVPETGAHRV
jgi:hypothetical protein